MNPELAMWILGIVSSGALAIGAWFFKKLDTSVSKLGDKISSLQTAVTVLGEMRREVMDLRDEIRRHKDSESHAGIDKRVTILETKFARFKRENP